ADSAFVRAVWELECTMAFPTRLFSESQRGHIMRPFSQTLSYKRLFRLCAWGGFFRLILGTAGESFAQRYQVLPGPNEPRRPKTVPSRPESSTDSKTLLSVELVADKGVGYQAQM